MLRKNPETVVVETFEVSAANGNVMSTQGRLTRTFPGRAVTCPSSKFFDTSFQSQFQLALCRLATEAPPAHYKATATKSGVTLHEERDTTHPGFVNDYLMTVLSVIGADHESLTTSKHVRDDVLWQNVKLPWRRAPFWLLLRVAVLRTLSITLDPAEALQKYKLWMIEVVARLLKHGCDQKIDPGMLSIIHAKLARRVFKFEQACGEIDGSIAQKVSDQARKALEHNWSLHVDGHDTIRPLPVERWLDDTSLSLPTHVRQSLTQAIAPLAPSKQLSAVALQSPPRIVGDPNKLPSIGSAGPAKYLLTVLFDVELWVEQHLDSWTVLQLAAGSASACSDLAALIENYWRHASSEYSCSPLEKSNALLVIIELWVALDKLCTQEVPLLLEYSPEITTDLFECLAPETSTTASSLSCRVVHP